MHQLISLPPNLSLLLLLDFSPLKLQYYIITYQCLIITLEKMNTIFNVHGINVV